MKVKNTRYNHRIMSELDTVGLSHHRLWSRRPVIHPDLENTYPLALSSYPEKQKRGRNQESTASAKWNNNSIFPPEICNNFE